MTWADWVKNKSREREERREEPMPKERQIDIGMTLDERILDYLKREDDYRSPECIAEVLGETLRDTESRCMSLYWDPKNGMQRICQRPRSPEVIYRVNSE